MIKIGKSFLFFFCFIFLAVAHAGVTVQSIVDRDEMGMGDTLTLTISIQATESVTAAEPRMPHLDQFDLVNSWTSNATSSKLMQGPNGMQFETVRKHDFNYMITPKKAGTLVIPPFSVVVDGTTYTTKSISIKVSAQGSGATQVPKGLPQEEESEEEQIFNQLLQQRGALPQQGGLRGLPKNANEALSLQLEVDKTEVYEGEQIVANWYIYTRGNLLALDRLKFPDLKGFWKEIIEEVPALNFTQEVINGVPYRKALLASHALFPIKPGTAIIDEYKIKGTVQIPTNPFSQFGFGQPYSFSRASDRVKIKVNPLPLDGKPNSFSGAVGQFDVQASVEGNQFPVNQPFLLKVRFEGTGNAKLIELPALNLPTGVELYETKSDSKYFKNGRSYKEFQVLIIPRQEGEIKIPSMSFSMFDPQAKKYVAKTTSEILLKIVPGAGNANKLADSRVTSPSPAPSKKEPQLPAPITVWKSSAHAMSPRYFIFVYALILLLLTGKAVKELGLGKKQKNIRSELQKRLKQINQQVDKLEWRAVGTLTTNLIYFVLGEVAGVGGANKEISKLLEEAPPSLRRELGGEFTRLIDLFQVMSFAPDAAVGQLKDKEQMKKNVKSAQQLLEKAIELMESKKN